MYNYTVVTLRSFKNTYHLAQAALASLIYGFPSRNLTVIGVTGTDGKTTTTHLIHHLLTSAGKKASLVSSVYAEIAGKHYDTGFHVTTPDSFMLQKFLAEARDNGEQYLVLEVTSHGLDQQRVWGINFSYGVLTNVTHEHLDYHKDYKQYLQAKEKLLLRSKVAVVNLDDASYKQLSIPEFKRVITYGMHDTAMVSPKSFPFTAPLPGEYNRYNSLAAIAVASDIGITPAKIKQALASFAGIKGRFEKISTHADFDIIIDFAHTPNAIEKVLSTLRPMVKGRLIHVFGSAGLRDATKRPIMGEKSATYADVIILTEEDYRTENLAHIIDSIAAGCLKNGAREVTTDTYKRVTQHKTPIVLKIPDREAAIQFAIRIVARKGDTVILTGKAHEKSLCRGTVEYPWSEHEAVARAVKGRSRG